MRTGAVEESRAFFACNSPFSCLRRLADGRLGLDPQGDTDASYQRDKSFLVVDP
ncbi:hypothetical protein [Streptomyces sp. NPDC088812]|uniref:hypothetical protein n=1 Tax=Streptomyces sp. NPDC088812 TaxID=3365905 RepID=UPI00382BB55B